MAEVINLWGGVHEAGIRRPHEPPPRPIPDTGAVIVILPLLRNPLERQARPNRKKLPPTISET